MCTEQTHLSYSANMHCILEPAVICGARIQHREIKCDFCWRGQRIYISWYFSLLGSRETRLLSAVFSYFTAVDLPGEGWILLCTPKYNSFLGSLQLRLPHHCRLFLQWNQSNMKLQTKGPMKAHYLRVQDWLRWKQYTEIKLANCKRKVPFVHILGAVQQYVLHLPIQREALHDKTTFFQYCLKAVLFFLTLEKQSERKHAF